MAGTVSIHFEGLPQVKAMLDQYSPTQLQNKMRRVVRAGAQPFRGSLTRTAAQMAGSSQNVPLSFQKVKPPKVSTRGGGTGREIEAYVRPTSPLFNIFQVGAGRHRIAPKRGPLRGPQGELSWTAAGRKRGSRFFSRRPVSHPGIKDRDLLEPAFEAKVEESIDAIVAVLFGGTAVNSGIRGNTVDVFFP